jgi:hypothetical protein
MVDVDHQDEVDLHREVRVAQTPCDRDQVGEAFAFRPLGEVLHHLGLGVDAVDAPFRDEMRKAGGEVACARTDVGDHPVRGGR